jgi:DNA-binding transcriptional LysR family regulator
LLSVQQLRALVAVIETGTVTGAATVLGRTQSQASRLISSLEEELGFTLFERQRRKLVPTRRGARFYEEARHALAGLDNINRVADDIRQDKEAELRILAPNYTAHSIVPRALSLYCERFPSRRYSVEILVRNTIGSWIAFHPFDVGIASLPFDVHSIKSRRLAAVDTVVVMPKGHPLADKKRTIRARDLAEFPFVAMKRNTPLRRRVDEILEREGVRLNVVGETSTALSVCQFAAQGLGCGIVDAVVPLAFHPSLIECRLWEPGLKTFFGLIYPATTPISQAAEDFSSLVSEVLFEPKRKFITRMD